MTKDISPEQIKRYALNVETGRISWPELARFFAAGKLILVSAPLDLVEVAVAFSEDNGEQTEQWILSRELGAVTDEQAMRFNDEQAEFWAIVVKPWVIIQLISGDD